MTTDADLCRQNGWKVGDVLERADNKQHMRITGIGENGVIGRQAFNDGGEGGECFWEIAHYDWRKLEPEPAPPSCSWEAKVAELEKQLAEVTEKHGWLTKRNKWLNGELTKTNTMKVEHAEMVTEMQRQLDTARRVRDEYLTCAESWRARYEAANAELDELRNRTDSQTDRGDAVITAHAETVVQLTGRITELEAQLAQVRAQRNASQDDALRWQEQHDEACRHRDEARRIVTQYEAEVAKLKAEKAEQALPIFNEGWNAFYQAMFVPGYSARDKAWQSSNARRVAGGGE